MMTIAEAEAEVKAAVNTLMMAEQALDPLRQKIVAAKAALLGVIVDGQPLRIGDVVERKSWRKNEKIDRAQIVGFRHRWGTEISLIMRPLKKDGTPSKIEREDWDAAHWVKVATA